HVGQGLGGERAVRIDVRALRRHRRLPVAHVRAALGRARPQEAAPSLRVARGRGRAAPARDRQAPEEAARDGEVRSAEEGREGHFEEEGREEGDAQGGEEGGEGADVNGTSPLDVAACVSRIRARNDALNAVLHVVADPRRHPGAAGAALDGVPYVLKDTW